MRIEFICWMIAIMSVMLVVAMSIEASVFTHFVVWILFVYIIVQAFVTEFISDDAQQKAIIMSKLNRILEQVKRIV